MPHDPDPRDPVLDASVVLGLARRHLPSARAVTAVDETGGEARAYVIDEDFVFKTQRPHRVRPRTSLEKEAFHLDQLARHAPDISVPRVLGYGRQDGVEYLLMTRMPGVAMRGLTLAGEARAALLRELGAALRGMHGVEVRPFRSSGLFPGDADTAATRTRLEGDLQRAVEAASAMRAAWSLAVLPEEAAARVRAGLEVIDEPPVPLHSNPGPEHVFVDPDTLRLAGVIDFGDAYLSHPALDFQRWPDNLGWRVVSPMCTVQNAQAVLVCDVAIERVRRALNDILRVDEVAYTKLDGQGTLVRAAAEVDAERFQVAVQAAVRSVQPAS